MVQNQAVEAGELDELKWEEVEYYILYNTIQTQW
jgi:hypothetical protein